MFRHFITLQWKSFFRSASVGKSIALKLFLAVIAVYFALIFLTLGIRLYPILEKLVPDTPPMMVVNRMVILWLLIDVIFRFFMQSLPVIHIKPLMVAPVKKGKIIHYVLLRSLISFYNLLPLLLIIPFGISCFVYGDYDGLSILGWTFSLYCLILSVNYINFIIKKKFTANFKAFLPFIVVVLLGIGLTYFNIFSVDVFMGKLLDILVEHPIFSVIPLMILIGMYSWNYAFLKKKFYLDASLKPKAKEATITDLSWTRRFGELSLFLQQDIKLIWRNKRPKTTIWLALIFLAYGMIFYPNETYHNEMPAMFVFVGIFISGIFLVNFGQFIPAWDSNYYSMMMAQNIPLRKYLDAKVSLISFSVVVLFVLSTPYVYFGWNILLLNLVCALYNLGVNTPLMLYAGSFNRKRIDLEKSPFMNYQGTGAAQWLVGIPLLLFPLGLWYLVYKLTSFEMATLCLSLLGITGLLMRNYLMRHITEVYRKNKYAMINGFKQQGT